MSWNKTIVIGLILGCMGAYGAYAFLDHVDAEMRLEQALRVPGELCSPQDRLCQVFSANGLALTPEIAQSFDNDSLKFSDCGLEPESACDELAAMGLVHPAMAGYKALAAFVAPFTSTTLPVVNNDSMQPFGKNAEDDSTAAQIVQPSFTTLQTTWHAHFLQPAEAKLFTQN